MKNNRHVKILEVIDKEIILTQEDLQNALLNEGFNVTQSTVSRDIKELKLVKSHDAFGNYRYLSSDKQIKGNSQTGHYSDMFSRSVKSIDYALNNIVLKCYNGMASSAGVAIDALFSERILGSLAGDDTVLIVTKSEEDSQKLTLELKNMI